MAAEPLLLLRQGLAAVLNEHETAPGLRELAEIVAFGAPDLWAMLHPVARWGQVRFDFEAGVCVTVQSGQTRKRERGRPTA